MNRTKAREYAFILLFEYKFQPDAIAEILNDFINDYKPGMQEEYIKGIVNGVVDNISLVDAYIDNAATGWSIERISAVSISVLRLAVFEMLYRDDIPSMVSLNEAISIGKLYGGDESAAFLNGVLSNIMHTVEAEKNA